MPSTIAAVLIARDEARCIARCIASVRPYVDRVVVLDTGSADGTPEIAREAGAEVHYLAWPGSFAAARNHALVLADADWHLILDADEWLISGGEALRDWCRGEPRLGRVRVLSQQDQDEASARSWITRLLPRSARFVGRVHEQVAGTLPREKLELTLGHDGYLAAQMAGKAGRNRALLLLDLADHPGDPYIAFQLGKEAEGANDFAEACDWYAKALAGATASAGWLHELAVRTLHALGQAGRLDAALAQAEAWRALFPQSPDFFFTQGNLLLDKGLADPARALDHWLPRACAAWERCLEIGEQPDLEGSVAGRGSRLATHNLALVRQALAGQPG